MSIGTDIKDVWAEVGISYTILRDGGNITGEYGDIDTNAQITKPFIREFFMEISLSFDTAIVAGDVLLMSDGRKFLVMNKTPEVFEDSVYMVNAVLYKVNCAGNIFRLSSSRTDYQMVPVWTVIKRSCNALLTESFFGNDLDVDEPIGNLARESQDLYVPHNYGLRENDRFDLSTATYSSKTTVSGTTDSAQAILVAGAPVDDTWTVTFTSATDYTVVGASKGSVGSGSIAAGLDGDPYFSIPTVFFTGTWAMDETYVFTTVAEYYRVTEIKTRRYTDVDLATLEEDTR